MKKIFTLLAFVIVALFTSCTDLDDNSEEPTIVTQETQGTEQEDASNPNNSGTNEPQGPS